MDGFNKYAYSSIDIHASLTYMSSINYAVLYR